MKGIVLWYDIFALVSHSSNKKRLEWNYSASYKFTVLFNLFILPWPNNGQIDTTHTKLRDNYRETTRKFKVLLHLLLQLPEDRNRKLKFLKNWQTFWDIKKITSEVILLTCPISVCISVSKVELSLDFNWKKSFHVSSFLAFFILLAFLRRTKFKKIEVGTVKCLEVSWVDTYYGYTLTYCK